MPLSQYTLGTTYIILVHYVVLKYMHACSNLVKRSGPHAKGPVLPVGHYRQGSEHHTQHKLLMPACTDLSMGTFKS